MAKKVLQSVGDDTVAFDDTCFWVAENVKRFLGNFTPGMEVEVTVKDVEGTPMVTFLKKAGFGAPAGNAPHYGGNQGGYQRQPYQNQGYNKPAYQPQTQAPRPAAPAAPSQPSDLGMFTLAATIALAYQLDPIKIKELAAMLRAPPKPPVVTPPPMAQPPMMPPQPVVTSAPQTDYMESPE